jgi:two-component system, OmpR family, sensor histidine kinase MtrB
MEGAATGRRTAAGAARHLRRARNLARRGRNLARRGRNLARRARKKGRRLVVRFLIRWRRSLQLRVVATTLLLSAAVVAVLGFFLLQQISVGLLRNKELSAQDELSGGMATARGEAGFDTAPSPSDPQAFGAPLANQLQARSSVSNPYVVVVRTAPRILGSEPYYSITWCGDQHQASCSIPAPLITQVTAEQRTGDDTLLMSVPTRLQRAHGSVPALVVGAPLGDYQLYYLFPLDQEQQTLLLLQRTLAGVGLALVLLLAAIASLVTRWVVIPLREAAQASERLTGGHLEERMAVHGTDDLARLGTSFNQMARSLQDKIAELQELSKVQRQFVSDVSHELRTPLTTIRIAADVLFEAKDELGEAEARSAELLQSQLERFESLLVDLLEISRYDANAATLETEQVDIRDLVLRAVADAQQIAERRGSGVELRLPGDPCIADVDSRRVERILRNLIVNAVEHGEGKDVLVSAAIDSYAVAIAVRDYGVGLRPGEETMVFDRFWRADPARARTSGGTGLGLSIALEDARLHGGWLQAWGEVGKGSVFRLTLPRCAGEELQGSPLPLVPPGSAGPVFGIDMSGLAESGLPRREVSAGG